MVPSPLFVNEQLQEARFSLVRIFPMAEPSRKLQSGEEKDTRLSTPQFCLPREKAEFSLYNPISSTHTNHY